MTDEQLEHYQNRIKSAGKKARKATTKAKRTRKSNGRSEMERNLMFQIQCARLPEPEIEYKFYETRKWRADFAWPEHMLIAEYEGGIWTGGSHTRGKRYESDCEKYNAATLAGWRVLRFTHDQVKSGYALNSIRQALSVE